MNSYLVSIGIATRNRDYYAEKVVRQIYKLRPDIQIAISDNSDINNLESLLGDIIDNDRVKYQYTSEKISVVKNYNNTVELSSGEYFMCIGDDDVVLSNIIYVAKWMKEEEIDAVKFSREITYIWPGASSRYGRVSMTKISSKHFYIDCTKGVIDILKNGCQDYMLSEMVGAYHELVSMKRMREVKDITGVYFGGFSPDIYIATCLSLLPKMKCVYCDFPVSIPGSCAMSASNRSAKGIVNLSVKEAISRYSSNDYVWSEIIPYYYTPETVWAETMIKAIHAMNRNDLLIYFNKSKLVNTLYHRWTTDRDNINDALTEEEKGMIDTSFENEKNRYTKFHKLFRRLSGEVVDYFFVKDNFAAERKINKLIKKFSMEN